MTLAISVLLSALVHASPDSDCTDMIRQLNVPLMDIVKFRSWCLTFTNACRDIEDDGAQACGANSPRSRQINAMMDSVMKIKTNSAITRGDQGLKTCDQTDILRDEQNTLCKKHSGRCKAKVETFTGPTTGKKIEVKCEYYVAEALAWSDDSRKRKVCNAIEADRQKALDSLLEQREACTQVGKQVDAYSGNTRKDREGADALVDKKNQMACGVAGCRDNGDGTATRQEIVDPNERPAVRPTPASASTPTWAQEPEVDKSVTYDRPGMQCGICGCVPNGKGGYNRILKCFN